MPNIRISFHPAAAAEVDAAVQWYAERSPVAARRVSWLVGSQSFLLTAFVLLRNQPAYYPRDAVSKLEPVYLAHTDLLGYLVAVAGLLISVCSFVGVLAAFMAITAWRSKVKIEERKYLTSDATWNFWGGLAAFLPGPVLASVWVLLLAAEWPFAWRSGRRSVRTSRLP
jgi:hypothetical protein